MLVLCVKNVGWGNFILKLPSTYVPVIIGKGGQNTKAQLGNQSFQCCVDGMSPVQTFSTQRNAVGSLGWFPSQSQKFVFS